MGDNRAPHSRSASDTPCAGRFAGKTVLVTGAASGIGLAVSLALAREGAHLALLDRDEAGLTEAAQRAGASGRPPLVLTVDLASREQCAKAVAQAAQHFGKLDLLCHNAAVAICDSLTSVSPEDWSLALDVNLSAALWLARAAVEHMPAGASIVNTSSLSGQRALWGGGAYGVTKAALNMLTRALARELAPRGIRVNAVLPATVATGFGGQPRPGDEAYATWAESARRANPLGRLATAEDIARVVLFLASDDAAHITGAEIVADGGFSA